MAGQMVYAPLEAAWAEPTAGSRRAARLNVGRSSGAAIGSAWPATCLMERARHRLMAHPGDGCIVGLVVFDSAVAAIRAAAAEAG